MWVWLCGYPKQKKKLDVDILNDEAYEYLRKSIIKKQAHFDI